MLDRLAAMRVALNPMPRKQDDMRLRFLAKIMAMIGEDADDN